MQRTFVTSLLHNIICIHHSDGEIRFQATPSFLTLNERQDFSLKCHWAVSQSIKIVQVMRITKMTNLGIEDVATLRHPDVTDMTFVKTVTNSDLEVTYWKHQNCCTLSVMFRNSSSRDAGTYTCHVVGVDEKGSFFTVSESLDVALKEDCSLDRWYYGPKLYNNSTYYLSKFGALNVGDAASRCQSLGGYLMEVNDDDEFKMAKKLTSNYGVQRALIAGSDQTIEGTWIFPRSGLNVTYLNWIPGQPDNFYDEDCLQIISLSFMNDIACSFANAFFCEIEVSPSTYR